MVATNASSIVFSTWELCESILKFLPCNDLVRAKRICLILKDVVDQTAALQQPLFLQPRTDQSVWTITRKSASGDSETDELLAGPNMARYTNKAISDGEMVTKFDVFELHPALKVYHLQSSRNISWYLRGCAKNARHLSFYDTTEVVFENIIHPVAGIPRHSSLDKMFLSQPPARHVRIALKCRCRHGIVLNHPDVHAVPNESIAIRNDVGITFGQLRDKMKLALRQCPTGFLDHLMFGRGLLVTKRQKQAIEATGELSWEGDPLFRAGIDIIDRLGLFV